MVEENLASTPVEVSEPGGETLAVPWTKRLKGYITVFGIWAVWAIAILGFQFVSSERMGVARPDNSREWTAEFTQANSNNGKPYLIDPMMNRQVAWDSEYYLSIAVNGYEDPRMRRVETRGGMISQNYAFYPLYPLTINFFQNFLNLLPFDFTAIGRAALMGVLVSIFGTLVGCLAFYDLAKRLLDEDGAIRAVFFMLIFPSAFFFAQVYSEGLFTGLMLAVLACIGRKKWLLAALLTVPAIFARAIGLALVLPLGWAWLEDSGLLKAVLNKQKPKLTWQVFLQAGSILIPVAAYAAWSASIYGKNFHLVEDGFFGRNMFDIPRSIYAILDGLRLATSGNPQAMVLHQMEFASLILAIIASFWILRKAPGIGLYCLLALAVPIFSGSFQSNIRYVLAVPALFLMLASLGKNKAFDRGWTLVSVLLLAMETFLFTYDMWVA